jgi:hypothetical protein
MLRRELELLDQAIDNSSMLEGDRELSRTPDLQGLGSSVRNGISGSPG